MDRIEGLFDKAKIIGDRVLQQIREGKNILIVGHLDADGITSTSIMAKAILRKGGRFIAKITNSLRLKTLQDLKECDYDFYIFCELGAGIAMQMREMLGDRWINIDHHQIGEDEKKLDNVINSWQFDIDGSKEVSAAGMSYIIASKMDEKNIDLSWLAVVGALGDRQDQGEGRSMLGLNKIVVKDAIESGYLKVTRDLMLYGRETKPIHEAIASTIVPFISGLTGNRDACLAALTSAGIKLKEGARWRTIAELSEEEKKNVVETIIPYIASKPTATDEVKELIGDVYILEMEDEYTPLRDCREFATLLNACGRMRRGGVGISICLRDRDLALKEGEKVLAEYRSTLSRYVQTIMSDDSRLVEGRWSFMIVGDGLVDENLLGSLSSILSDIKKFEGKAFFVRTTTEDGEISFSARLTQGCNPNLNLGVIMEEAKKFDGVGGGHDVAAGSRVPSQRLNEFLEAIEDRLRQVNEDKGQNID
ncbi:MAG: DHH family phosphoesterase [Candidatus Methylarchaceae archaeon HK02M1]|nr:DHH family phosphoesterase [Candidatus Methylarchaceae archaeon HK02M1]